MSNGTILPYDIQDDYDHEIGNTNSCPDCGRPNQFGELCHSCQLDFEN